MYFLCSILSFVLVDLWHLLQQEPIKCSSVFMLQGSPLNHSVAAPQQ